VGWLKMIGMGILSVAGVVAGLALGRFPGAALVALSLFFGVVVVGLAVARLVGELEARRVSFGRMMPKRVRPKQSRARCRTCGRKRAYVDGFYVCDGCDGVAPTPDGVTQNARPG
jgi:hypothetical protein